MRMSQRRKMVAGAVLLLVAMGDCKNGWDGTKICAAELKWVRERHNPSDPTSDFSDLLRGVQELGGDEAFAARCSAAIAGAISACEEHQYGSDSGLDCKKRRVEPAIKEFAQTVFNLGMTTRRQPAR